MTVVPASRPKRAKAAPPPQLAPPVPLKGDLVAFVAAAAIAGIELMPWQLLTGRYMTATASRGWLYPEIGIIVPRQNGKTTLLLPRIIAGLLAGEKIMHTAQNREFPREIYGRVADILDPALMAHPPRFASGQERIDMLNGGSYRIVAPTRGGGRGPTNDLVIVDELREFDNDDFIAAAEPTLTVSERPQMLYLSNAGHDGSVVLNTLRRRAATDPNLCYIEWSAPPDLAVDDRKGWRIANPALQVKPWIMEYLERKFRSYEQSGQLSIFETEHLCRWAVTMAQPLVADAAWMACQGATESPAAASFGFNMDPNGRRASVVRAWQQTDGRIALEEVIEAIGDPIDTERLGTDLQELTRRENAKRIGFASWTDADIARYVPRANAVDGKEFAAASEQFARYVSSGRLVWDQAGHVGDDLRWASRKSAGIASDSGAWMAVPSSDRSITAILAAVRAVWLASAPKPPAPRIG